MKGVALHVCICIYHCNKMFVCKIWHHFILLYYAHLLDAVRINEILM